MTKKRIITITLILILFFIIIFLLSFCSKNEDKIYDVFNVAEGVNKPVLNEEMMAVKWNGKDWVEVLEPDKDATWYEYKKSTNSNTNSNEWANAKTKDGSMWVWIPRYAYKISNNKVEVIFLKNIETSPNEEYLLHPAFSKDVKIGGFGEEIVGFWVSKVEAGKENGKLLFKPNLYSYNNITIGDAYNLCKDLPYNETDPHMIKSSEWGAVAYLSASYYGRYGTEIAYNNTLISLGGEETTSATAGGNGRDNLAASTSEALINNQHQSTTANVYGVYDMAGGLWERVAAYINNGNNYLLANGKSLLEDGNPNESNKYKTVYNYDKNNDTMHSNFNINKNIKGDAIFETSDGFGSKVWFDDYASFMFANAPFLHRGGGTNGSTGVGIFAYSNTPGQAAKVLGFRCTLVSK